MTGTVPTLAAQDGHDSRSPRPHVGTWVPLPAPKFVHMTTGKWRCTTCGTLCDHTSDHDTCAAGRLRRGK